AFYDRAWREAAEALGASWEPVGAGIAEITLGDFRTRVVENTCAIDDPVTIALLADKPLTYRVVARESVPVPRHLAFTLRAARGVDRHPQDGRQRKRRRRQQPGEGFAV